MEVWIASPIPNPWLQFSRLGLDNLNFHKYLDFANADNVANVANADNTPKTTGINIRPPLH